MEKVKVWCFSLRSVLHISILPCQLFTLEDETGWVRVKLGGIWLGAIHWGGNWPGWIFLVPRLHLCLLPELRRIFHSGFHSLGGAPFQYISLNLTSSFNKKDSSTAIFSQKVKIFGITISRKYLWTAASDAKLIYWGTMSYLEAVTASCFLKITFYLQ